MGTMDSEDMALRVVGNEDTPSVFDGVGFGKLGLVIPDDMGYEQWEAFGERLQSIDRAAPWWIGDWLNYGERKFGEMYTQALDVTSKAYQTLANRKYVAGVFPMSKRRAKLSFSHHAAVASLVRHDPSLVNMILDEAEHMGHSEKDVRAEAKKARMELGLDPTGDEVQQFDNPYKWEELPDDTLIYVNATETEVLTAQLKELVSIVKELAEANNGIDLLAVQDKAKDWLKCYGG